VFCRVRVAACSFHPLVKSVSGVLVGACDRGAAGVFQSILAAGVLLSVLAAGLAARPHWLFHSPRGPCLRQWFQKGRGGGDQAEGGVLLPPALPALYGGRRPGAGEGLLLLLS